MLEKADKLNRSGVSTGTIKSFFNAHSDEQFNAAMKQLDGKKKHIAIFVHSTYLSLKIRVAATL